MVSHTREVEMCEKGLLRTDEIKKHCFFGRTSFLPPVLVEDALCSAPLATSSAGNDPIPFPGAAGSGKGSDSEYLRVCKPRSL